MKLVWSLICFGESTDQNNCLLTLFGAYNIISAKKSEAFLKILNLAMSLSTYVILPVTVIITKNNFKPNLGTKAPN